MGGDGTFSVVYDVATVDSSRHDEWVQQSGDRIDVQTAADHRVRPQ